MRRLYLRELRHLEDTPTSTEMLDALLTFLNDEEEQDMGKSSAQRKEFDDLMVELRRQGWALAQTGNGHWKATPPDKRHTIVHFSISGDPHAFKNTISDLRKRSFIWPPKKREEVEQETVSDDESFVSDDKVEVTSDEQLQAMLAQQEAEEQVELEGQAAERHVNGVMREHPAAYLDQYPHTTNLPDEDEEERMERLFKELKEAKSYLALADSELVERENELVAATKRRDDAREERARAAERLRSLKSAFDTEFAGDAP